MAQGSTHQQHTNAVWNNPIPKLLQLHSNLCTHKSRQSTLMSCRQTVNPHTGKPNYNTTYIYQKIHCSLTNRLSDLEHRMSRHSGTSSVVQGAVSQPPLGGNRARWRAPAPAHSICAPCITLPQNSDQNLIKSDVPSYRPTSPPTRSNVYREDPQKSDRRTLLQSYATW